MNNGSLNHRQVYHHPIRVLRHMKSNFGQGVLIKVIDKLIIQPRG